MEIQFEDRHRDHAAQLRILVVPTTEAPAVIVEKVGPRLHRPLVATTAHRFGGPDRDRRRGGPAVATTRDPRDGSDQAGEIALLTDRVTTTEFTPVEAASESSESHIAAATTKKLRFINRSSGGN